MSTPQNDLLQCTVCSEVFVNACTLDCFHTFCRKCVVSFTKTQPEAVSVQSLSCPFCHRLTKVPDADRPIEEWAVQVPASCVVQDLLKPDDAEDGVKILCDLCNEEGEIIDASARCSICDVTLCDGCLKAHRRNPASRHHDIANLSEDVRTNEQQKLTCTDHEEESIKFHCKDCKKSLCHSCCRNCHRLCKNVESIESLMPEIQTSLQDSKDVLAAIIGNQLSKVNQLKSKFDTLRNLKLSFQTQITSTCQKITDVIKTKERKLIDELDQITGKSLRNIEDDIKEAEMSRLISQQNSNLIDHVLNSRNEMHMYETYLSCGAGVVQLVDGLVTGPNDLDTVSSVDFIQDIDRLYKDVEELDLGRFEVLFESRPGDLKITTPSQETTYVAVLGDDSSASPTDVIAMVVNGGTVIVVTDWGSNKSVKSFYNRNGRSCHSRLSLYGGPYSLTKMNDNQVAVTVPDCKQIVTFDVNPELKLLSTISTKKEYWSITALTSAKLAAGSQSPSCVDILDMTGAILRTLRPHNKSGVSVKYPNFLCATKRGNILVSDCGTKSVLCLTQDGEVLFNYTPTGEKALKSPRGITTTSKGDILVADFSLHKVLHLTESGMFVKNILTAQDDLQYPHGLFVEGDNCLHVSVYSEGCVKVFQCS